MPFSPRRLDPALVAELANFADANDFATLYRAYSWKNDTYTSGFPDMLALEARLAESDMTTGITLEDVKKVAEWGLLRNQGRITGAEIVLPRLTLHTKSGGPNPNLSSGPTDPIRRIQNFTKGVGPTYLSKVVRFALPQECGAIDTRCVRVYGQGDPTHRRYNWIRLAAHNYGDGWSIPKAQAAWPDAYAIWIDILRYFASILPKNCPHPKGFVAAGLRNDGVWECADVEMALFAHSSQFVGR